MRLTNYFRVFVLAMGSIQALSVSAAPLAANSIVQGNLCVGTDCFNAETFSRSGVMLKENNTRVGLWDTSATSVPYTDINEQTYVDGMLGDGWQLAANDSTNGGLSYFSFGQESSEKFVVLSDGTAPDYDCTQLKEPFDPVEPYPRVGEIPAGQPAETTTCAPYESLVSRSAVSLGADAVAGIALGFDAELSSGAVSLGTSSMTQRLARVAHALQASDALVLGQLEAGVLQDRHAQLDALEAELDALEDLITAVESQSSPRRLSGGGAVTPACFLMLLWLRRLARGAGVNVLRRKLTGG